MTATPIDTGWLATLRESPPGASTAPGPAAKSPNRELTTVATDTTRALDLELVGGKAPSPTTGVQRDTAKDTSSVASARVTPAESTVIGIQLTQLDDVLRKYEDEEERQKKRQEALTTLCTMSPEDRNRTYRSAHLMRDKGELTAFHYINSKDLKESCYSPSGASHADLQDLGIEVDTSVRSTLVGMLKSAFKKPSLASSIPCSPLISDLRKASPSLISPAPRPPRQSWRDSLGQGQVISEYHPHPRHWLSRDIRLICFSITND